MHGLAYLLMVSRQRGDALADAVQESLNPVDRYWCSRCQSHRVQARDDTCPCCKDGGASDG